MILVYMYLYLLSSVVHGTNVERHCPTTLTYLLSLFGIFFFILSIDCIIGLSLNEIIAVSPKRLSS